MLGAMSCHPASKGPGVDGSAVDLDRRVRLAAFRFLTDQTHLCGDVLPRETLTAGIAFEGVSVPLSVPPGIFKPALLSEMPISITAVPTLEGKPRPYADEVGPEVEPPLRRSKGP
jgi:hypothetical protein